MSKANLLNRRSVVGRLLADRKDAIVVGGLGASTYDIAAAGDSDRNLYLWGAMGGAVMIGLGIALAQPTLPVVVITGDGDMLMGMGSLATVGLQKPKNLTIVVLDNEVYGETGGQASHTAGNVDLVGVARSCGIADARSLGTLARDRGLRALDAGHGQRAALCQRQDRQRQSRARALQPRRPVHGDTRPRSTGIRADLGRAAAALPSGKLGDDHQGNERQAKDKNRDVLDPVVVSLTCLLNERREKQRRKEPGSLVEFLRSASERV